MLKIGLGYDAHRLVKGRKLFLGGVEIPYDKGLEGHSDADVLLHAICDAILGALGKGDIGEKFPNTDPQYKNIASVILLKKVNDLTREEGYAVHHVDAVIIAQEPQLKDFKNRMRFHIAYELAVEEAMVNIKATTHEGMGFIGRKEGIAALATVTLIKKVDSLRCNSAINI
jgi:2-C-methyl-D-erythritol 2,4-cyclodiphosphate synthase